MHEATAFVGCTFSGTQLLRRHPRRLQAHRLDVHPLHAQADHGARRSVARRGAPRRRPHRPGPERRRPARGRPVDGGPRRRRRCAARTSAERSSARPTSPTPTCAAPSLGGSDLAAATLKGAKVDLAGAVLLAELTGAVVDVTARLTGPGRHTDPHDHVVLRPAGRLRPRREARHRGRRPRGPAGPRRRAARRGRGGRPAAPRALRHDGQGQLPGQPQVRTLPGELQLLLAGARLDRGHPQVQVAQHRRGAGAGGRRSPGRRHPGLHGLQRPRPDQQGRRAGRRDGRHHQVRAPRGRDLRLPGAAQGRPGRAAARGRRRRLQPQHQHRRVPPRPDRADPHVRRPRRHRREGQDRRALAVQRAHRRARRDRRAAGRGAVRAQGARLRLDPGQLPDAVRRHAAARTPGSSRRCAA